MILSSFKILLLLVFAILIAYYLPLKEYYYPLLVLSSLLFLFALFLNPFKKNPKPLHPLFEMTFQISFSLSFFCLFISFAIKQFHLKPSHHLSQFQKPIPLIYGKIASSPKIKSISQKFHQCQSTPLNQTFQQQEFLLETTAIAFENQKPQPTQGQILIKNRNILPHLNFGDQILIKKAFSYSVSSIPSCPNFNYSQYLRSLNIDYIAFPQIIQVTSQANIHPIQKLALKTHSFFDQLYSQVLSNQKLALVQALILGQKEKIPPPILNHFQRIGVSHILALSGLHVGLIALFLFIFFSLFQIPRKIIAFVIVLILAFYVHIVGVKPSILRAVIMFGCAFVSSVFNKTQNHYLNSLFLAALIILFIQPLFLFQVGFQLSFLATLGILIYFQPLKNLCLSLPLFQSPSFKRFQSIPLFQFSFDTFSSLFILTFSAQIFIIPILINSFQGISLISLISNLPIVFLTQIVIALSFLLPLLSLIPPLFLIFSHSLNFVLELIISSSIFFSKFPLAYLDLTSYPLISNKLIFLYYLILPFFHLFLKSFPKIKNL